MEPETPAAPAEARLIRTARLAAGMSAAQAARATEGAVSATYWRDVERGYGGRRGQRAAARASDGLLAAMARVTGVTPDQLDKVQREDAARVLTEILRREGGSGPAEAPAAPRNPFAAFASQFSEPEDDPAWDMFPDPADKLLRWIWRMPVPVEDREQLVADIRARRRAAQEPPRRESACLPG
jgi:transcriptional regulator with XRE-family HTH domain